LGQASFSLLQTVNEAYKVQQLQGDKLSAYEALYHATIGGAKALDLQDQLGNFNVGKEADFVVLNLKATALQSLRQSRVKSIDDALFALFTMGDDRNIEATYIYGQCAYQKPNKSKVKPRPWLKWTIFAVVCSLLLKRDQPDKRSHSYS
jgi:guanine deaminase